MAYAALMFFKGGLHALADCGHSGIVFLKGSITARRIKRSALLGDALALRNVGVSEHHEVTVSVA